MSVMSVDGTQVTDQLSIRYTSTRLLVRVLQKKSAQFIPFKLTGCRKQGRCTVSFNLSVTRNTPITIPCFVSYTSTILFCFFFVYNMCTFILRMMIKIFICKQIWKFSFVLLFVISQKRSFK